MAATLVIALGVLACLWLAVLWLVPALRNWPEASRGSDQHNQPAVVNSSASSGTAETPVDTATPAPQPSAAVPGGTRSSSIDVAGDGSAQPRPRAEPEPGKDVVLSALGELSATIATKSKTEAQQPGPYGWSRASLARPLDYDRLLSAIREKYELDRFSDPTGEFERLKERSDAGDPEAALVFGLLLAYGTGMQTDPKLGAFYFERAANAGIARARAELGRLFLLGYGVAADTTRAANLFREAWNAGDAEGAFLLAGAHRHGLIPGADEDEAARWLAVAAESGHTAAQKAAFLLGEEFPVGTEEQRVSWLSAAAESGDLDAMYRLARHLKSQGSIEKARTLLETAAEQGSYRALLELVPIAEPDFWKPEKAHRLATLFDAHVQDEENAPPEAFHFLAMLEALADPTDRNLPRVRELLQIGERRGYLPSGVAIERIDAGENPAHAISAAFGEGEDAAYVAKANRNLEDPRSMPDGRVRVKPRPIEVVQPIYPAELYAERIEGRAVVHIVVGADGRARDPEVIETTHPAFGAAAVEAILRWRFAPATVDGRPVNVRSVVIPVSFNLPE